MPKPDTDKRTTRGRAATRKSGMRREYDFSKGARGVTAKRFAAGSNIVVLDPDVAALFPDSASVNQALRALAAAVNTTQAARRSRSRGKAQRADRSAEKRETRRRSA